MNREDLLLIAVALDSGGYSDPVSTAKSKLKLRGSEEKLKDKDLIKVVKLAAFYLLQDDNNLEDKDLKKLAKRVGIPLEPIEKQVAADMASEFKKRDTEIEKLRTSVKEKVVEKKPREGVLHHR